VDQSFDKAFVLFKKAAEQNNHSAENMLAQMYAGELAAPTREDPSRSNEWVSYWVNRATARGDTSAFCDVGLTYAHHIPLPDKNRAIYWLQKGVDRGDKYCAQGLQYWTAQWSRSEAQSAPSTTASPTQSTPGCEFFYGSRPDRVCVIPNPYPTNIFIPPH
jgi:TPR repeat protein